MARVTDEERAMVKAAKDLGHICWDNFVGGRTCEETVYSSGSAKAQTIIWHAREFLKSHDIENVSGYYSRGYEDSTPVREAREKARLALIKKNDAIALALWTKLENQRIVDEQAEIKRLADVAELQRQAAINAENLRIKLLKEEEELQIQIEENRLQKIKDKETQRTEKAIPLLVSIIPLSAIGLLLLYTSKGKL